MTQTISGSPDHVNTYLYREKETYEVGSQNAEPLPDNAEEGTPPVIHPLSDALADKLVNGGFATEGASSSGIKPAKTSGGSSPGPSETK